MLPAGPPPLTYQDRATRAGNASRIRAWLDAARATNSAYLALKPAERDPARQTLELTRQNQRLIRLMLGLLEGVD